MVTCECGRQFKRSQDYKVHIPHCKGVIHCSNPECNIQLISYENKKYCSIKCATLCRPRRKHTDETRIKISKALGGKGILHKHIYKCLCCEKEISNKKYCSNYCQNKYIYKTSVKEWLNDPSLYSNYRKFMKRWLFEKHNNKCQKCGWNEVNVYTGNIPLEIHHIDADHTNNFPSNFELLCPNCHSLTDTYAKNRKYQ